MGRKSIVLPRGAAPLFLLFLVPPLLWLLLRASPSLALTVDAGIGAPLRALLSRTAALIPQSVTEITLCLLPLAALLTLPLAAFLSRSAAATRTAALALSLVLLLTGLLCVLTFAVGGCAPPLAARLHLVDDAPSSAELSACAEWLASLAEGEDAHRHPPRSLVIARLREEYAAAGERYGFTPNVQVPVKEATTHLMARLGILGLYAFPFGEVTVSTDCPDGVAAFTVAHEMAHASGFSREEEADAVAFLVSLDSGDPYLTAMAAEGLLGRMLSSLYENAPTLWRTVSARLSEDTRRGIAEANESYEEGRYAPTAAGESPDCGRAVRLAVAIYRLRGRTTTPQMNIL